LRRTHGCCACFRLDDGRPCLVKPVHGVWRVIFVVVAALDARLSMIEADRADGSDEA
jgi:hypothetical protein